METINEELSYVPMYKSYIDAVAKLTPEDRLVIYEAIFEYGFTNIEPTFDNPYLEMGWNLVKPNLVNNINRMRKNKSASNGKNGGRPKKADITIQPKINLDTPKESSNEIELKSEVIVPEEIKEVVTNKINLEEDIAIEDLTVDFNIDDIDDVIIFKDILTTKLNKYKFSKKEIKNGIIYASNNELVNELILDKITQELNNY